MDLGGDKKAHQLLRQTRRAEKHLGVLLICCFQGNVQGDTTLWAEDLFGDMPSHAQWPWEKQKKASFFGWLTLKGNPCPKKEKRAEATGQLGAQQGVSPWLHLSGAPAALRLLRHRTTGSGTRTSLTARRKAGEQRPKPLVVLLKWLYGHGTKIDKWLWVKTQETPGEHPNRWQWMFIHPKMGSPQVMQPMAKRVGTYDLEPFHPFEGSLTDHEAMYLPSLLLTDNS